MARHTVVLIPGDGIGPEVSNAARRVIDAAGKSSGAEFEWVPMPAGEAAIKTDGDTLPEKTLEAIKLHKIGLKGPVGTPIGKGFRSVNVTLRKKLDLYAAVRPVRSMPGVKTRYENVDIVIFRENTEGLYTGIENEIAPGVVTSLKVATEKACDRISRAAFRYANRRKRKRVTVFHKANIMKITDGLFLKCAKRVWEEEYPNIEYEELIIDNGCMQLVKDPTRFDVLLMENLYGDLISDLCAGLVGGLGVVPGANIGDFAAVFEAVHGTAPDIAGKGLANPLACVMSGVMMLNHIHDTTHDEGCRTAAAKIKDAYNAVLSEGKTLTKDLGGNAGTDQ
ncbi:MAG TPA: isocitrate/isopropylmalate dehydrogenase family protein, partial [Phycisphaerae bacterium]|nr:isocitrate/isopropylmalate dehydrogenase family protein [Phycisphaerae bacterium]